MNELEKLCPQFLQTPNAAGIIAFLFNDFMTLEMRNAVPEDVAEQIGRYMQSKGYGMVFNKFYKQFEEQSQQEQQAEPVAFINEKCAIQATLHGAITLKPGDNLYTHPAPAVAVNEQLLEALRDFSNYVRTEQSSTDGHVQYSNTQINRLVFKVRHAIAAAEAAKGGV